MELRRHIPFPGFVFRQYTPHGELNVAVTVIATYEIKDGNKLELLAEQPPILLHDAYSGSDNEKRHLIRQADFIPYKPGTDVTVLAYAYAPTGQPQKNWLVGIKVGEKEKVLRVHGPRQWLPRNNDGWIMGEAKPISKMQLSYYEAFGGPVPQDEDYGGPQDCNRFNPVGPGIVHETLSPKDQPIKAPRIAAQDEPIDEWNKEYIPQGLAPIAPVWRFRQQYAGTYDETWLETQHPFLPPDFDYHFYQCAHPDLIFEPYLKGYERIQLVNLHPIHQIIKLSLPGKSLGAVATKNDGTRERSPMVLDGVHFDLASNPDRPVVKLTWRTGFRWDGGIVVVDVGDIPVQKLASRSEEAQPERVA